MKQRSFWDSIAFFESGLSVAEWAWRIVTFLLIGGSGTVSALVAKTDPLLNQLGPIYWIGVGLITALVVATILYLVKLANLKQAQADFSRVMSVPRNTINPLAVSFQDTVIPVEDLRLPTIQLHENKHFKRCKFVGPAAIAILGGTYSKCAFNECGEIVALPENVLMTGIVVLKNCTVEECEFVRTSIFTDQGTAQEFSAAGAKVKGIVPNNSFKRDKRDGSL
ncbi:MAG: hypothetical protein HY265_06855 [Deltaproteobacteria bacterium]|nr:hypothetical protein [Deltaproteobacteria bacterium]